MSYALKDPTPEQIEQRRARWRAYYYRHHEKYLARAKQYKANRPMTEELRQKQREATKRWTERHPETAKARSAVYKARYRARKQAEDPAYWQKVNERRNLRRYGLTSETFAGLLARQGGTCAICHQPETAIIKGKPIRLSVDHDHRTARVRGLLCFRCNAMIGTMNDDAGLLRAAANYIESAGD